MSKQIKIVNVVGARPNLMKIAPIMSAYEGSRIDPYLVHTGQHYDQNMSDLFFRQLGIPEPDMNLGVGSSTHAVQTAQIMTAFEPIVRDRKPDAVLVVGDVNSTIACGLVSVQLGIKLIHVEAGLRSFDRAMPEEINRILTDSISDILFCTEQSAIDNLQAEGIAGSKVHFVGNVMIDTLVRHKEACQASDVHHRLGVDSGSYAVLTLHRPSNVDDPSVLAGILDAVAIIADSCSVVFPVHPRTVQRFEQHGLADRIRGIDGVRMVDPVGYLDFMKLMMDARVVLTDSGGIQEETTILGVPCLTLRENTERPVTVTLGTNQVVGTNPAKIIAAFEQLSARGIAKHETPPLWDGKAAGRIVDLIEASLA